MKFLKNLVLIAGLILSGCSEDSLEEVQILTEVNDETPKEELSHVDASSSGFVTPFRMILSNLKMYQEFYTEEALADELCFHLNYPITVIYNDETSAVVNSNEQLLEILLDETVDRHLNDIVYPFEVTYSDGNTATIEDASGFDIIIEACGYDQIDYEYIASELSSCFSIGYPINLIVGENALSFENQQEIQDYFINNPTAGSDINLSYPVQIKLSGGETEISIENDYELLQVITDTCGIE